MFASWAVVQRARKPLLFLVAALATLGAWAYLTAPQSVFPQISLSRIEVFAIVKNMLARGERPIQARVQKMLSVDSLKAWKTLGRFLNEATGKFMIPQTEHLC